MEAKNPPTGIAAAAQAYQLAMSQQPAAQTEAETTDISANLPQSEAAKDITMADESVEVCIAQEWPWWDTCLFCHSHRRLQWEKSLTLRAPFQPALVRLCR
jgi:hypothetical protein